MVINVRQAQDNFIPLNVETSVLNPYFLITFTNPYTNASFNALFSVVDSDVSYYTINIEEVGSSGTVDYSNGKVQLSPAGSWEIIVYAQSSSTNLDPGASDETVGSYDLIVAVPDVCVSYPPVVNQSFCGNLESCQSFIDVQDAASVIVTDGYGDKFLNDQGVYVTASGSVSGFIKDDGTVAMDGAWSFTNNASIVTDNGLSVKTEFKPSGGPGTYGPNWHNIRTYAIGGGTDANPDNFSGIFQSPGTTIIASHGIGSATYARAYYNNTGSIQFETLGGDGTGFKSGTYYGYILTDNLTDIRSYQMPDESGTIALTTLPRITSLNGLTAATQLYATGTSGTDFNISSSGGTHTFNLPIASATNTGKLSSTDWSTFNDKLSSSLTSGNIFVGNASNIAADVTPTLNATAGTFGLSNTGVFTFPDASTTARGWINTTTQSLIGQKNFRHDSADSFSAIVVSTVAGAGVWSVTATGRIVNVNSSVNPVIGNATNNSLSFITANTTRLSIDGSGNGSYVTSGTSSLSAEQHGFRFGFGVNRGFANGTSLTNQRELLIQAPTYIASAGTATITNPATVAITGAPIQGTGMTLTNSYAFWVQGGGSRFDGRTFFSNTTAATVIADSFQMYSADIVAGNAAPNFLTENGDVIKIYSVGGWGTPTGTLTRTTFDPATVTLSQLAERVAALLTDLKTGHQLLKA